MGFSIPSFAQKSIGVNMGYFELEKQPISKSTATKITTIGLRYEIKNLSKNHEELNVWLEENYESIWIADNKLNYFKTGLGFDLNLGNKLYYVIGTGLVVKILTENSNFKNNNYGNNQLKKGVFSAKVNTGLGYKIFNRFFTTLLVQYNRDISPTYSSDLPQQFGTKNEYVYSQYILIQLNISFLITK